MIHSNVDPAISEVLAESGALMLDVFAPFIDPMEKELGALRQSRSGRRTDW